MTQITPKEFEQLSAYLDGLGSVRERTAIEKQLQTRPEYRQTLDELRQMRTLVRNLPARKVPHNFTLTRAMAQEQRLPRFIPFLKFSSVLSALVMVFLFVLQFGPSLGGSTALAPAAAPQAADTYKAVEESAVAAAESESVPIIVWNPAGMGGGGGGYDAAPAGMGMGGGEVTGLAAPVAEQPVIPLNLTPESAAEKIFETPVPTPYVPEPTPAPTIQRAQPTPAPEIFTDAANGTEANILGINTDEAGQRQIYDNSNDAAAPEEVALISLIWPQLLLAALALGSGLAAIFFTRKFRRG